MDIINNQSSKIIHLNKMINEMKHNNINMFRGNCDPDPNIHSHNTVSTESEVSQKYQYCPVIKMLLNCYILYIL